MYNQDVEAQRGIKIDPDHLEAGLTWSKEDRSREGLEGWLRACAQESTRDQVSRLLGLMAAIKSKARENALPELGERLGCCRQIPKALDLIDNLHRHVIAHQIVFIPNDQRPTYVIGDLHADLKSLMGALEACGWFSDAVISLTACRPRLVFMGDYVDRGHKHLGLLTALFTLKYLYDEDVILLKGNHDGGYLESNNTVKTPYYVGPEEDPLIYFPHYLRALELKGASSLAPFFTEFMSFFESLPIVATWRSKDLYFFAVHGGILRPKIFNRALTAQEPFEHCYNQLLPTLEPPLVQLPRGKWFEDICTLKDLTKLDALDEIGRSRIQNLLWSDPTETLEHMRWHTGRFRFTRAAFEAFKDRLGFDVLLRGHVVETGGFKTYYDGQVWSVYSTGGKLKDGFNDDSAYPEVQPAVVRVASDHIEAISL